MLLSSAETLARQLMAHHGLHDWDFAWDRSKRRFGVCRYPISVAACSTADLRTAGRRFRRGIIGLSAVLTPLQSDDHVRHVLLHEIAHALAGPQAKHGYAFRAQARAIGCALTGPCGTETVQVPAKFIGTCPDCGRTIRRHLRKRGLRHTACALRAKMSGRPPSVFTWTVATDGGVR